MRNSREKSRIAGAAYAAQQKPELVQSLGGEAKRMAETMPADEVEKLVHLERDKAQRDRK